MALSRELPLGKNAAVLVIDAQNYCWEQGKGIWAGAEAGAPSPYYWEQVEAATANIASILGVLRPSILGAARNDKRAEVLYTVIEALTPDARDHSLDYKISGLSVGKGSWEAQVVAGLAPGADDIVLPKGSSSVFCSTNVAYVLRNLGVDQVVLVGGLTDQCVESAVRDACDAGFLVTLVADACVTHSAERHANSLRAVAGYCRRATTAQVVAELAGGPAPGALDAASRRALDTKQPAYVRFEVVVDLNGKALSKTVPREHAGEGVFMYSGALAMGADARVLTFPKCVGDAGCPNWRLEPQWDTLQRLPWASSADRDVFRVYCETLRGSKADAPKLGACPRAACARRLAALKEAHGVDVYAASELEFVLTDDEQRPRFSGVDIFSTLQFVKCEDFAYAVAEQMRKVDVDVRTLNCEYGDGQLEITFAPKFGIAACDAASTFKTGVKELALRRNLRATFSSKPFGGPRGVGNGGHFNFSLWRGAAPATHAGDDADGLADGSAASSPAGLGPRRPHACARVKADPAGDAGSAYFEYRAPSAAANAYLVLAGLAAAGQDGLDRRLELPPPKAPDAARLPTSLPEALDALKADGVLAAALGDDLLEWFDLVKRAELAHVDAAKATFLEAGQTDDDATQSAWNDLYFAFL
ncbi:isochorismatase [Aureococcus anophagefferens]|uniref:Lengsin n=1 Tax=Aureococcus anophagefferens TaxID=44056 RepID=A0ABR1GF11_AURAN